MIAKLIIELREDGQVYVHGPIHEKQFCLDLLDEAKRAVINYQKTQIIVPDLKKIIK